MHARDTYRYHVLSRLHLMIWSTFVQESNGDCLSHSSRVQNCTGRYILCSPIYRRYCSMFFGSFFRRLLESRGVQSHTPPVLKLAQPQSEEPQSNIGHLDLGDLGCIWSSAKTSNPQKALNKYNLKFE
jgi:hypothetical protein